MSIYLLPALASLLFKCFVVALVLRGGKVSILFLSLVIVFAFHNAIELFGYIQFLNGQTVDVMFRLYYVATAFLLMYVLLHGLAISELYNVRTVAPTVLVTSALSILLLFTDLVIAGQYSIGYAVTAVKGPFYWLFAVYLLIVLSSNVAVLLYRYKSAAAPIDTIRSLYSLFALSPVMLVCVVGVILKLTEANINAAGLIPIGTALFLAIVLKGESQHRLSDLRRFLPFSPERKVSANLMSLVDDYVHSSDKTGAYKKLQAGIEKEIIFYTLDKCDNNITKASDMMGLKNRSSLYSMMNRLEIDLQQLKVKSSDKVQS